MNDERLGALRLVFVTPGCLPVAETAARIEAVLEGGVTTVLLREPQLEDAERRRFAKHAVNACHAAGALCLVSRDLELAGECDADGVHLGWGGPSVEQARSQLAGRLVGRSAHWPLVDEDLLADYVTLSPFHSTPRSHPRTLLSVEQVAAAVDRLAPRPVLALGGMTAARIPDLPAGIRGVAVIRALSEAPDPRASAAVLRSLMDAQLDFGMGQGAAHGL